MLFNYCSSFQIKVYHLQYLKCSKYNNNTHSNYFSSRNVIVTPNDNTNNNNSNKSEHLNRK